MLTVFIFMMEAAEPVSGVVRRERSTSPVTTSRNAKSTCTGPFRPIQPGATMSMFSGADYAGRTFLAKEGTR